MPIDFHTHSTASDGSLSPRELVKEAHKAGLSAIALTDHDTVAGVAEAVQAGEEFGVEVVPGCELSTMYGKTEMHILGLWLPPKPARLQQVMDDLVHYRHNRNHIIIDMLNQHGVDITYDEVVELAGEGSVGRPHIAEIIMRKGFASSIQGAFDEYLGTGGKAYAPKKVLTSEEAVTLLTQEGATVILAHPYQIGIPFDALEECVVKLKTLGLDGVEAYYSTHSDKETRQLLALAQKYELCVSGGSDFHGAAKPTIALGRGKGGLFVPDSVLEHLKERRKRQGLAC